MKPKEWIEGRVLAGKYRVERVLGVGGMGVVVAARHLQLDERVAIKFMHAEALSSGEAVARFAREARTAVKIKSEHVARVSDVGTLETGAPYMVMEYLEGSDLSALLTRQGRLPVEQAVDFILQAGEAVAEAHALGIVHRDLKPANLFVIRKPDGELSVKVLDFGISKMALGDRSSGFMTKTSALLGSPQYMAPEQMHGARGADCRSDIWALGVVLYELVTGSMPFVAHALPELVLKIAMGQPEPFCNRALNAPPGFEAVVMRCLEKDPARRFATVRDLAQALIAFAPQRSRISLDRISGVLGAVRSPAGPTLLSALPATPAPPQRHAGTAKSWGQTAPPSPRRRRALVPASLLLACAGLGTAGYVAHRMSSAAIASATAPVAVAPSALVVTKAPERARAVAVAPSALPPPKAITEAPVASAAASIKASLKAQLVRHEPVVSPLAVASAPPVAIPATADDSDVFDGRR